VRDSGELRGLATRGRLSAVTLLIKKISEKNRGVKGPISILLKRISPSGGESGLDENGRRRPWVFGGHCRINVIQGGREIVLKLLISSNRGDKTKRQDRGYKEKGREQKIMREKKKNLYSQTNHWLE